MSEPQNLKKKYQRNREAQKSVKIYREIYQEGLNSYIFCCLSFQHVLKYLSAINVHLLLFIIFIVLKDSGLNTLVSKDGNSYLKIL
jgi:hypothetical protein